MSAGERCQENGKLPRRQFKALGDCLPLFVMACAGLFSDFLGRTLEMLELNESPRMVLSFATEH